MYSSIYLVRSEVNIFQGFYLGSEVNTFQGFYNYCLILYGP